MRRFLYVLVLAVFLPFPALATPIVYSFSGHVTDVSTGGMNPSFEMPANIAIGDGFVGYVFFADGLPAPGTYDFDSVGGDSRLFFDGVSVDMDVPADRIVIEDDGSFVIRGHFSMPLPPHLNHDYAVVSLDPSGSATLGHIGLGLEYIQAGCGLPCGWGSIGGTIDSVQVSAPEPISVLLIGTGLVGLAFRKRRQ